MTPNDLAGHAFLGADLGDNALTTSPRAMDSEANSVFEQEMFRHSIILPDHHDPTRHHLGHVHHQGPPEDSPGLQLPSTRWQRFKEYLQAIRPIYFPTLLDWNQKSLFIKFLAITSVPMVLLLTLTLPVVELCDEDEDESQDNSLIDTTGQEGRRLPKIVIGDKPEEEVRYDGWSRTATTVQMVLAPVFVASVITSKSIVIINYIWYFHEDFWWQIQC
jgi:sodium/potassium/calcium exchanger 6